MNCARQPNQPDAKYYLSRMYRKGYGVTQDDEEADK
jgi:TPR repeat protein